MPREAAPLSSFTLFYGLDERQLAQVVAAAHRQLFSKGDIILYEGERCKVVYLIARGRVRVSKVSAEGRQQVLALLGPGEALNLVPLFDRGVNPASAEALTEVEAYAFSADAFLALVEAIPRIARNLLTDLAGKLRELVELVEDLSFRTVSARLARFLLSLPPPEPGQPRRWTQEEIAAQLGTVREMVGRVLRTWQDEGIVRVERGRVVVLERERLEEKGEA